jgi:predicted enzyme related to lactoylglutathione lyase
MTSGLKTVIYPVRDLEAAKRLFTALLGAEPAMDEPYYVQFHDADQEIGLDPHGHDNGMTGPVAYWHVDDIEATFAAVVAAGATEQQPVQSVGGTRRIATVTDTDGNVVGLLQP